MLEANNGGGSGSGAAAVASHTRPSTALRAPGQIAGPEAIKPLQYYLDRRLDAAYVRYFETAPVPVEDAVKKQVMAILHEDSARGAEISIGQPSAPLSAEERAAFNKQNRTETDRKLKGVLPPEDMAALIEYRASLGQRSIAEKVAAVAMQNGVGMAPEKVDELTKILHQQRVLYVGDEVHEVTPEQYDALSYSDAKAIAAAQKILTPPQLELLKANLSQRISVRR